MGDFATGLWSGWAMVIIAVAFGFIGALLYTVFSARGKGIRAEGEVWDDTLREGNAEPPKWWFYLYLVMIVTSCAYLVLYPGFGGYRGALQWTQFHQLDQAQALHDERFGTTRAAWAEADLQDISSDPTAMRTAAGLFIEHCSACHGRDGKGVAGLFPDLTNAEWQWGGSDADIVTSITKGRVAVMVPHQDILGGPAAVTLMADYVRVLAGLETMRPELAQAREQFATVCAACHLADGSGDSSVGAPSLVDDVWFYGADRATVIETIRHGRNGIMPAQEHRLDPARIRLLAAYVAAGFPATLSGPITIE